MTLIKMIAGGATVTLMMATLPAMAYTGQELAKQAKVSIGEARTIEVVPVFGTEWRLG
jgi:hypothetical protein